MAHAYNWRSAWEQVPDDDPHFAGRERYPLYTEWSPSYLYEGDRFWDTRERYIIEVNSVQTLIYQGVVGYQGEEGYDAIFYDRDWSEPEDPYRRTETHWTDDVYFYRVSKFTDLLEDDTLVPHRGNGLPRRPP